MTTLALLPSPATPLSHESAAQAFADILDARTSEEEIARFLSDLSDRKTGDAGKKRLSCVGANPMMSRSKQHDRQRA